MAINTLINGETVNEISFQDRGLQYGDGVFETIAVCQNKPLCLDEHLARLNKGCKKLSIPIPESGVLKSEITSIINTMLLGVVKVVITRGQGGRGYALPEEQIPTRIVTLYPWPEYIKENALNGIETRICQYRYSYNPVLAGIKHLNRLEQILARSEWNDKSISEGIVMDQEGYVIEGTMSNIFCVKDNVLFTPDVSYCGVAGIIRQKIIEQASDLNIELQIKKISLDSLLAADEVFVCNSVIGLWPVNTIDSHAFSPGPITEKVKHLLEEQNCICRA